MTLKLEYIIEKYDFIHVYGYLINARDASIHFLFIFVVLILVILELYIEYHRLMIFFLYDRSFYSITICNFYYYYVLSITKYTFFQTISKLSFSTRLHFDLL